MYPRDTWMRSSVLRPSGVSRVMAIADPTGGISMVDSFTHMLLGFG